MVALLLGLDDPARRPFMKTMIGPMVGMMRLDPSRRRRAPGRGSESNSLVARHRHRRR